MSADRPLIIANPQSAGGALGRRWDDISGTLTGILGPLDHRFTTGPGDGARQSRRALTEGRELVVAMGGDGTISEVADGFFDEQGEPVNDDAALGVLPFGTGGDFIRTVRLPRKLEDAARQLAAGRRRRIDVGRLTCVDDAGAPRTRHFINIASFGIGGLVDTLVNRGNKALGGRLSFGLATVRATATFRPQRALISLDGGPEREVELQNVAVANGRYFGGGMKVAPEAELDDGLFDVVTIGPMSLRDVLLRGHLIYRGAHLDLPQVSLASARRVEARPVDPAEAILLDVDGETPGRLPATFEIIPGALPLRV